MSHTLLLADDNATTQRLIELTFAEQGVRVVTVTDGQQAVDRLATERPDIVLADVNMPRLDGYQLASYISGQPSLKGVPVLLLTGAFDVVDDRRVRESGAAGVLVKPFEPGLVINRVKELLGLGKADRPPASSQGAGRLVTPDDPHATGGMGAAPRNAAPPRPPQAPTNRSAPPPTRDAEPPPPPAREPERTEGPAGWDQLREESGLGPDTRHVEGGSGAPDDYFDRLDAAFNSLDAQLAGRTAPHGRRPPAPPAPRMPAAIDPAARAARQLEHESVPAPAPQPAVAPVLEADSDWFDPQQDTAVLPNPVAAPASAPASARTESSASYGGTSPKPAAPAEPFEPYFPQAPLGSVADAFDVLLAAEQGEPSPHAPAFEISDDVIERIASRVAERLSEGLLRDTVTQIVTEVSERLVREEIARIRAAAQARR